MATPKELVAVVSDVTGVPENTVVQHDRNLSVAGLRTMAGRGRAAAQVTFTDAANLLIAVAGSRNVKDSAATVNLYVPLPGSQPMVFDDDGKAVVRGLTFGDALAALLEIVPAARDSFSGPDGDWVTVSISGPVPGAVVEFGRRGHAEPEKFEYAPKRKRGEKAAPFADLQFIARFTQVTLGFVGEAVQGGQSVRSRRAPSP